MTPGCCQKIMAAFSLATQGPGQTLLYYGQPVPGLFVVLEGQCDVILNGSDLPIAQVDRGQSVGEMSFVEGQMSASADVITGAAGARYIFCERDKLLAMLTADPVFAKNFYRGVAHLISERLRSTNRRIGEQLERGSQKLQESMQHIEMFAKLGQTKSSLDQTGFSIVSHMGEIATCLTAMKAQTADRQLLSSIAAIEAHVEKIMLNESQAFDRICQMLDQLAQHFANLKSVVAGGNVKPISGDLGIFDAS